MILLFLSIILILCTVLLFSFTYKVSGINNTLLNCPPSVFEIAIPLTTENKEIVLYYNQKALKESYESYLEKEAKKYVETYKVEYFFYNTKDGGVCDINDCQGVEIYFEAEIMFNYLYKRTMHYEIKEGKMHG